MPLDNNIRIRAFRAVDDLETCRKFIEGHRKVLSIYGIENITTNTEDWVFRRSIFVIVVETLDGQKLYGGARIQVADGTHPLPIEEATGKMDHRIYEIVRQNARSRFFLPNPLKIENSSFGFPSFILASETIIITPNAETVAKV